jgi:hypothetical protein
MQALSRIADNNQYSHIIPPEENWTRPRIQAPSVHHSHQAVTVKTPRFIIKKETCQETCLPVAPVVMALVVASLESPTKIY